MKKTFCTLLLLALMGCNETTSTTDQSSAVTNQKVSNVSAMIKPTAPLSLLTSYKSAAEALIVLIDNGGVDTDIENASAALVKSAKPILRSFIKKFPQCQEYLTALNNAADTIPTLTLAEIETGYHADGKLPAITDANCYHAKDLLVHPATVQAMAKIGINDAAQRADAKAEIVEVISHFSQVEQAYKS
jgi:hypothetical protein